ncbi:Uncharacterised protein [Cedecea neteri]|uniref:Uncharacterized protein n=1 Tax=Cedecea neteri TaxID=158822 RepID=A0A2X3IG52_9ENTR|nr:Uncharacterised protein [Cedecea neteri]
MIVMLCGPSPSVEVVIFQVPLAPTTALPSTVVPLVSYSVTVLPMLPVPVKVGVLSSVRLPFMSGVWIGPTLSMISVTTGSVSGGSVHGQYEG